MNDDPIDDRLVEVFSSLFPEGSVEDIIDLEVMLRALSSELEEMRREVSALRIKLETE